MRRRALRTALVAGTTAVLALGGGFAAWASWSAGSSETIAKAKVARIPVMAKPRTEMSGGSPKIVWDEVTVSGAAVDHYVVIRSDGSIRQVACAVSTGTTTCHDTKVAPGSQVQYYVHATLGAHWVGKNSEPSDVLSVPDTATTLVSDDQPAAEPNKSDSGKPSVEPAKSTKDLIKKPETSSSAPEETPKASPEATEPSSVPTSAETSEPSASSSTSSEGQGAGSGGQGASAPAEAGDE
jgi:hypothetical protein